MELQFYEEPPVELPHPPIPLRVLLVVEQAVVKAWEMLRQISCAALNLLCADEDTITDELRKVLCDKVLSQDLVDGFSRHLFVINRDAKFRNFDGRKRELMPDLCVSIIDRPHVSMLSHDGLFVECKPVDRDHPAGSCYCGKGLIRFVNGDYAWAMQEAMMVGYARKGYTISPKLDDALEARSDRIPRRCGVSKPTSFSERVCITEHGREFQYVETGQQPPPITIRHLWLRRD